MQDRIYPQLWEVQPHLAKCFLSFGKPKSFFRITAGLWLGRQWVVAFQAPGPPPGQGQLRSCQDRQVPSNEAPVGLGGGAPCPPSGAGHWVPRSRPRPSLPCRCWEGSQGLPEPLFPSQRPSTNSSLLTSLADRRATPAKAAPGPVSYTAWYSVSMLSGILQTKMSLNRGRKLSPGLGHGHRILVGIVPLSPGAAQPCLFQEAFNDCPILITAPFLFFVFFFLSLSISSFPQLQSTRGAHLASPRSEPGQVLGGDVS